MAHSDVMHETRDGRSSILSASLWMLGVSCALFFVPAVNGLVGGLVGGYKVRGNGRAVAAAVLPAVVLGVLLWLIFAVLHAPVIGFFSGVALVFLALISSAGLLLGAAIGGALSDKSK
ncbi:MAG TPA: hypothetical protein VJV79_40730 [Polyangiaceae bacterium]|nr:hypothetical protein [Polyangiaceae bacterium]